MKMQREGRDGDAHKESGAIKMEAEDRVDFNRHISENCYGSQKLEGQEGCSFIQFR